MIRIRFKNKEERNFSSKNRRNLNFNDLKFIITINIREK